jgi:hypothetical protein
LRSAARVGSPVQGGAPRLDRKVRAGCAARGRRRAARPARTSRFVRGRAAGADGPPARVQVGCAEIVGRIVEDLKDESEPYRRMVMETVDKVRLP